MNLCVEFDGCVYRSDPADQPDTPLKGTPIPGAFEWIDTAMDLGHTVFICSARFSKGDAIKYVGNWLQKHNARAFARIQSPKNPDDARCFITAFKPEAEIYIDPKGFCFQGQWPKITDTNEPF